jgi:hypothetical protein
MRGRSECDVVENRCELHMMSHQPTPSNICSGERNELAHVTQPSSHGNVLTELQLPRFSDSGRQNVVQFICQLNDYFRLKNVEESLKLPLAYQAVGDGYCRQWLATTHKDFDSYE